MGPKDQIRSPHTFVFGLFKFLHVPPICAISIDAKERASVHVKP